MFGTARAPEAKQSHEASHLSHASANPFASSRERYVASTLVGRRFHDLWMKGDHSDREIPPMTPIKLVSLAYIAHGMYMAFHNGKPLVSEKVRAWTYGPIFPELFNTIRIYGNDAVLDVSRSQKEQISYDVRLSPEETKFIDAAYQSHRRTVDTDLFAINHAVGTPWHDTWDGSEYRDIDNKLIFHYFREIVKRSQAKIRGEDHDKSR